MDNFSSIESDFVFPQRLTLFEQVSKTLAEMISHGKWAPERCFPMKSSSPILLMLVKER